MSTEKDYKNNATPFYARMFNTLNPLNRSNSFQMSKNDYFGNFNKWLPELPKELPEIPEMPNGSDIHNSVVEFNVNRLADILATSTKTMRQRQENGEFNGDVTITSSVSFGPFRLAVTVKPNNQLT